MSAADLARLPLPPPVTHGDGASRRVAAPVMKVAQPPARRLAVPLKETPRDTQAVRLKAILIFFGFWVVVTMMAVLVFAGRL